jgi:hypothetical protein
MRAHINSRGCTQQELLRPFPRNSDLFFRDSRHSSISCKQLSDQDPYVQERGHQGNKRKGNKVKPAPGQHPDPEPVPPPDDEPSMPVAVAQKETDFAREQVSQRSASDEEVVANAGCSNRAPENNFQALIKQLSPQRPVQPLPHCAPTSCNDEPNFDLTNPRGEEQQ